MKDFRLPDLGEGLVEAEIVAWHVSPGDHVVTDQLLVSVETAKAVVDLPSPEAGRIAAIRGKVGDTVKVGDVLVEYAGDGEADKAAIVGELPSATRETPAGHPAAKASPAVRARAAALGIDLSTVRGTGPEGTIKLRDLETGSAAQAEGVIRLSPVRRSMASNMARAHAEVVPATVTEEVDVSRWSETEDVTLRLILAVMSALRAHPALGAWYDADAQTLRLHRTINLGVAQDTPDGLFVPVLKDAGSRTTENLRHSLDTLQRAVRERTIAPQDMLGATFTLSNFGTIAGLHAALIVVPPQVAILGAGRIRYRPMLSNGAIAPGRFLPLSLTFDHRALTGGEAARFLSAVVAHLESSTPSEAPSGNTG